VWWPLRAVIRKLLVYRRWWQPAMTTTGLVEAFDRRVFVPRLRAVSSFGDIDVVRLRMLPGQVREDYIEQAPRLARTFGAYDCRVKPARKRGDEIELWLLRTDRLAQPVAAPDHRGADLSALPVAVREDGVWHRIRLLGTHVLIAGATGPGSPVPPGPSSGRCATHSSKGSCRCGVWTRRAGWSSDQAGSSSTGSPLANNALTEPRMRPASPTSSTTQWRSCAPD
jgi:hypothetical protein